MFCSTLRFLGFFLDTSRYKKLKEILNNNKGLGLSRIKVNTRKTLINQFLIWVFISSSLNKSAQS